jgi:hypothetical protein
VLYRDGGSIATGDNSHEYEEEYRKIASSAGFCDDYQARRDPVAISTQDDDLAARFDPTLGGRRVANFLRVLPLETQALARARGKSHVHNLEPEDIVALTVEAAAMARVPLVGTDWIPGLTRRRLRAERDAYGKAQARENEQSDCRHDRRRRRHYRSHDRSPVTSSRYSVT